MRVVSAYLLAVLGGNASPSEADIQKILGSVGIEAESGRIQKLLSELSGKDINAVLAEGKSKLAAMPAAGPAAAATSAGGGGGGAAPAAKKEEKKEEKPESDEDMGFSLFD